MFSQNYRRFLNIFKVNLHLKLKPLGRTFLAFYTELGIVQLKCMEFSLLQNPLFSNKYIRISFLLGTIRLFIVRNAHPPLPSV